MSQTLINDVKDYLKSEGKEITSENRKLFEADVLDWLETAEYETNNDFTSYADDTGVINYPYAIVKFIGGMILHNEKSVVKDGLKSRSMGTVSYTFKDGDEYPSHLLRLLDRFRNRKARFHVLR